MKKLVLAALFALVPVPALAQSFPVPPASEGEYDATLVAFAVDPALLAPLLPPQLEPGPQDLTRPHRHPVFLMHQSHLDVRQAGQPPIPGFKFAWDEFSILIPYLRLKGGKVDCVEGKNGPFVHFPIMHVNNPIIPFAAAPYGLNQHFANIVRTPNSYTVNNSPTSPVTYEALFGALEPLTQKGQKRFADQVKAFTQRQFGYNATTNTLIWSTVDWKTDQGAVKSVTVTGAGTSSFLDTLLAPFEIDVRGVNKDDLGGFNIVGPFQGSIPVPCAGL